MSDKPLTTNSQDLVNTEYDAERWARVGTERRSIPSNSLKAPSEPAKGSEVGLTQKGTDEDATAKRETEVWAPWPAHAAKLQVG
jgi:hypothetical protein